ncbi:hypothetical protein QTP88_029239 [Uroleucon formosanum]
MGASTVGKIVHETCQIIWDELVDKFMPVPSQEQLEKISDDFYRRWKFPNCIGCIDGKHCQIKCPVNSGSSYFNYLKYFSLVLQGVADADKKFITIEVGARGKQSDGGIFAASTLFQLLNTNTFNVPPDKELPGSTIKLPHFVKPMQNINTTLTTTLTIQAVLKNKQRIAHSASLTLNAQGPTMISLAGDLDALWIQLRAEDDAVLDGLCDRDKLSEYDDGLLAEVRTCVSYCKVAAEKLAPKGADIIDLSYLKDKLGPTGQSAQNPVLACTKPATRLPEIPLPEFNGDFRLWPTFRDRFTEQVDSRDISKNDKMYYLIGCLKGDAADALRGIPVSADNYVLALSVLSERFYRPRLVATSLVDKLLNSPVMSQESLSDLNNFINIKNRYSNLALADPSFHLTSPIDLLLGGDVYGSIMDGRKVSIDSTLPTAFSSVFGWILIGPVPDRANCYYQSLPVSMTASIEGIMERFWHVEEPEDAPVTFTEEGCCEQIFRD